MRRDFAEKYSRAAIVLTMADERTRRMANHDRLRVLSAHHEVGKGKRSVPLAGWTQLSCFSVAKGRGARKASTTTAVNMMTSMIAGITDAKPLYRPFPRGESEVWKSRTV